MRREQSGAARTIRSAGRRPPPSTGIRRHGRPQLGAPALAGGRPRRAPCPRPRRSRRVPRARAARTPRGRPRPVHGRHARPPRRSPRRGSRSRCSMTSTGIVSDGWRFSDVVRRVDQQAAAQASPRHALLQVQVALLRHAVLHELDRHEASDRAHVADGVVSRPSTRRAPCRPAASNARTFSSTGSRSNTSSVSSAAAHAAGSHDHVEPVETSSKSIDALGAEHRPDRHHAAAHRLAQRHQVGLARPIVRTANMCPVRPNPVFTSSAQSRKSNSRHRSTSAAQNASGGATHPPRAHHRLDHEPRHLARVDRVVQHVVAQVVDRAVARAARRAP